MVEKSHFFGITVRLTDYFALRQDKIGKLVEIQLLLQKKDKKEGTKEFV